MHFTNNCVEKHDSGDEHKYRKNTKGIIKHLRLIILLFQHEWTQINRNTSKKIQL